MLQNSDYIQTFIQDLGTFLQWNFMHIKPLIEMPEFMCRHLTKTQYRIVAFETMIMCLFLVMIAPLYTAGLRRCEFFEASSIDGVSLLMLTSVSYNLVGVSTNEVALHAVEM